VFDAAARPRPPPARQAARHLGHRCPGPRYPLRGSRNSASVHELRPARPLADSDPGRRCQRSEARATQFSYNPQGYLDTITDSLGRETRYQYDATGRVTKQIRPDGEVIQYAYDAAGNLTSVTPPGRPAHDFTYTPVDLQASYIPPDIGLAKHSTTYAYDKDRQLTRITRPDDKTLDFAYDNVGRLTQLAIPEGDISYAYDNATSNLKSITTTDGETLSYGYNGSLLTETTWSGQVTAVSSAPTTTTSASPS